MKQTGRRTPATPAALADPLRNHGVAFPRCERKVLGPTGRLPPGEPAREQQADRACRRLRAPENHLAPQPKWSQIGST
ncbi:hypothetical protein [Streptomyces adustus]|uniref:hypothetical protein n=1 Tax=Streptomyces adustus TaxID=1609272 RepID=UPI003717E85A